jgi:hypothetical protein
MAHTTEDTRRRLKESDKQRSLLSAENEQQAQDLILLDKHNEELHLKNMQMVAQLHDLKQRLEAAAFTTPASRSRKKVNISEDPKSSSLTSPGKLPASSRKSPPRTSALSATSPGDGDSVDTVVAGIDDHR